MSGVASFSAQSCVASARGPRLEQVRQIQMIGAEAHAVFAQRRARGLVETFDLLGDAVALQHAERLGELERDAARDAGDVLGRWTSANSGPSSFSRCALSHRSSRACTASRDGAGQMLVGEDPHARAQHLVARRQLADRLAVPAQRAVATTARTARRAHGESRAGARLDLAGERLLRGGAQRLAFGTGGRGVGGELEAGEPPDRVAFDDDFA